MTKNEYEGLGKDDKRKINNMYKAYIDRFKNDESIFRVFSFEGYIENDILKCEICRNWEDVYFLVDRNAINGGLGLICNECKKKM